MTAVARAVRAFAVFWWDFLVGDDWTVAAVVAVALVASWAVTRAGVPAWWIVPVAVVAVTARSLHRAVRAEQRG